MNKLMTTKQILASNCKNLRSDAALSQTEVANRAKRFGQGIDQKTVSRMENLTKNNDNPTIETINAMAAALSVEPWKMLMPDGVTQLTNQFPPKLRAILDIAKLFNDDGLAVLLYNAETLQEKEKYLLKPKSRKSFPLRNSAQRG